MTEHRYHLADVFTDQAFGGNPLAVFPLADELTDDQMQRIANELNLSESVFVTQAHDPAHTARLRIFTPQIELPMAGHPTVGAAFVLQREGVVTAPSRIICEEGVGPISVELSIDNEDRVVATMSQPDPAFGAIFENREDVAATLSLQASDLIDDLPVQVISTGVPFAYIPVATQDALGRIQTRLDLWAQHFKNTDAPHLVAFTPDTETATVRTRMFAPAMGIPEDPATGAASGPLGGYLAKYGLVDDPGQIVSEQGIEMGRPSRIQIAVHVEGEQISGVRVGGTCVYMGHGTLHI